MVAWRHELRERQAMWDPMPRGGLSFNATNVARGYSGYTLIKFGSCQYHERSQGLEAHSQDALDQEVIVPSGSTTRRSYLDELLASNRYRACSHLMISPSASVE